MNGQAKIAAKKSYEIVMEHLLRQIADGKLAPGEKLPSVVELASMYGVGRSTIREALSGLKAMGWLDIRQGGGTFVKVQLPEKEKEAIPWLRHADSLLELLTVRKILETGSAQLAAMKRQPSDLERLRKILEHMEEVLGDQQKSEQADIDFHTAIARSTQNRLLIHLMDALSLQMQERMGEMCMLWVYGQTGTAKRLLDEHRAIYEAVKNQDGKLASALMVEHLNKVEQVLKKHIGS